MSSVQGRIDIVEKVPDMAHHHAADLILRDDTVHHKAECHQHPGEIRGRENQQPQETKTSIGVAATPDVDQAGGQRGTQEREREER